ncbi:hypothetical protein HAX54_020780, partial [Datura stramonium]|nr:hypothetical protein [Datura stramonium]
VLIQDIKVHSKAFSIPVMRIKTPKDKMNRLASQMRSEMSVKKKELLMENITPILKEVDKEDIEKNIEEILFKESVEAILLNNIGKRSEGLEEACHAIIGVGSYHYKEKKLDLNLKNRKTPPS